MVVHGGFASKIAFGKVTKTIIFMQFEQNIPCPLLSIRFVFDKNQGSSIFGERLCPTLKLWLRRRRLFFSVLLLPLSWAQFSSDGRTAAGTDRPSPLIIGLHLLPERSLLRNKAFLQYNCFPSHVRACLSTVNSSQTICVPS